MRVQCEACALRVVYAACVRAVCARCGSRPNERKHQSHTTRTDDAVVISQRSSASLRGDLARQLSCACAACGGCIGPPPSALWARAPSACAADAADAALPLHTPSPPAPATPAAAPGGAGQPLYAYLLAPQHLAPGDEVASGPGASIKPGNCLPLRDIPVGMPINSIELVPGKGGQLCRAAGCMATIVNKREEHAIVRLPSGAPASARGVLWSGLRGNGALLLRRQLVWAAAAWWRVLQHARRRAPSLPAPPSGVVPRRRAATDPPGVPRHHRRRVQPAEQKPRARQGWRQQAPRPAAKGARAHLPARAQRVLCAKRRADARMSLSR